MRMMVSFQIVKEVLSEKVKIFISRTFLSAEWKSFWRLKQEALPLAIKDVRTETLLSKDEERNKAAYFLENKQAFAK